MKRLLLLLTVALSGSLHAADLAYKDGVSIGNRPTSAEWLETSGMCRTQKSANSGFLWCQSDGNLPKLFAISKTDGSGKGVWTLSGASCDDVEDMASATIGGQPYIYLAETGDNDNNDATGLIYRIKEPTITGSDGTVAAEDFETITWEFPAGDVPSHKDAETFLVDPATGDMYIITKRITPAKCYKLAHQASYTGTQTLEALGTISTGALSANADGSSTGGYFVGGDINASGTKIVLKSYTNVYTLTRNPATQTIYQALNGTLQDVPAYVGGGRPSSHPNQEPQGEAICFDSRDDLYSCSESNTTFDSELTDYPVFYYAKVTTAVTEVTFQEGASSYAGTADTYIWSNAVNQGDNRGAETTFVVDYDSASSERYSLLKFDISGAAIPANAIIVGCDLNLNISVEGQTFEFYKMLTSWTEASTWTSLSATEPPMNGTLAASSIETRAVHGNYDTLTGAIKVKLPTATPQTWVAGTATNHGWLIHNVGTVGDGLQFDSSESLTAAARPKLTLRYTLPVPGLNKPPGVSTGVRVGL